MGQTTLTKNKDNNNINTIITTLNQYLKQNTTLNNTKGKQLLKKLQYTQTKNPNIYHHKKTNTHLILNKNNLTRKQLKYSPIQGIMLNKNTIITIKPPKTKKQKNNKNKQILKDILQTKVDKKYYLNPKTAEKILKGE